MKNVLKVCFFVIILLSSSLQVFAIEEQCINNDPNDFTFHVNNQIDGRLKLSNSNTGLSIYSSRPTEVGVNWIRNTDSWTRKLSPLDFTGVSGSNNDLAHHANNPYRGGATLITPRHFITASHFRFENGSTLNFYDNNGNLVSRKIVNSYTVPNTDINIGLLDSNVDNIMYYQVISTPALENMLLKINSYTYRDLPIVVFNQYGEALIRSLIKKDTVKSYSHSNYELGIRYQFSKDLINGDSGQPGFIIINNRPILLFSNFMSEYSPNPGDYVNEINSAIVDLGNDNGYRIEEYKNTNFKTYSTFCSGPVLPPPSQFNLVTSTSCVQSSDQLKIDISWSNPSGQSMLSNNYYQYRLYRNTEPPDFIPRNTYSYIDTNVKTDIIYDYSIKLFFGSTLLSETKSQIKTPSLCSSSVTANNPPVVVSNPVPVSTPLSNYEPLPAKNNDTDKDGIIDSLDLCPNTNIDQKSLVNNKGCIRPKISKFNTSKDLYNIDLREVSNFEISNSYGKVLFTSPISLTRSNQQLDIDANLYISNNIVSLNSINLPELNRGAIITFNNFSYRNPVIYKDDSICTTCEVISYTNNTFRFKVRGFSNYSVIDKPIVVDEVVNVSVQNPVQPAVINQPIVQPVIIAQPVTQPIIKTVVQENKIPATQPIQKVNVQINEEKAPEVDILNTYYSYEDINPEYEKPSNLKIAIDFIKRETANIIDRIAKGFMRVWSKI